MRFWQVLITSQNMSLEIEASFNCVSVVVTYCSGTFLSDHQTKSRLVPPSFKLQLPVSDIKGGRRKRHQGWSLTGGSTVFKFPSGLIHHSPALTAKGSSTLRHNHLQLLQKVLPFGQFRYLLLLSKRHLSSQDREAQAVVRHILSLAIVVPVIESWHYDHSCWSGRARKV